MSIPIVRQFIKGDFRATVMMAHNKTFDATSVGIKIWNTNAPEEIAWHASFVVNGKHIHSIENAVALSNLVIRTSFDFPRDAARLIEVENERKKVCGTWVTDEVNPAEIWLGRPLTEDEKRAEARLTRSFECAGTETNS